MMVKICILLPYDGLPRLLEKTAILRDELFADIKKLIQDRDRIPRHLLLRETRKDRMLIASRPICIKAKEQAIPRRLHVF